MQINVQRLKKKKSVISLKVFGRRICRSRNFGEKEHARENKAGSEVVPGVLNKFLRSENMTSKSSVNSIGRTGPVSRGLFVGQFEVSLKRKKGRS